jgi:hypothetical protein
MQRINYRSARKLLKTLAPRAEVPWPRDVNSLHCQTGLKVTSDRKRLFDALSNRVKLPARALQLNRNDADYVGAAHAVAGSAAGGAQHQDQGLRDLRAGLADCGRTQSDTIERLADTRVRRNRRRDTV